MVYWLYMKVLQDVVFKSMFVLALQIYLLWSIDVVFLPLVTTTDALAFFVTPLNVVYILLQVIAFIYAGSLFLRMLSRNAKSRLATSRRISYALLYLYVLISLATSIYLTLQTPQWWS